MRAFIVVLATAGVAFAGYGSPAGRDDYDEDSYTKGAIVNNNNNNNNNAVNNVPSYQPGYGAGDAKTAAYPPTSYGSDTSKTPPANGYQAPVQTYAPVQSYAAAVPQTYSNNNAVKSGAYGRSQPVYGSAGRPSARLSAGYGPNQFNEPTQPIEPYSFAYTAEDGEGSHSHSASSDAQGRVSGEYTIQLADGRNRVVKYTADERGYRADIVTNELGTESKNPADVTIQSSALTGEQAALQFGQQYQRQVQSANYAFKGASRQVQPAYTPPAAARLTAPAPRPAAPAYVPASPVSGRLSTPTTEATFQGDHNAGYNDATATVDQVPLRPAVEQTPQRVTSDGGVRRRNKPSYG